MDCITLNDEQLYSRENLMSVLKSIYLRAIFQYVTENSVDYFDFN